MKNWRVDFLNMNDGRFENFWTATGALKYAKEYFDESLYIDIINEKLGIDIRLKAPEKHNWTLGMELKKNQK